MRPFFSGPRTVPISEPGPKGTCPRCGVQDVAEVRQNFFTGRDNGSSGGRAPLQGKRRHVWGQGVVSMQLAHAVGARNMAVRTRRRGTGARRGRRPCPRVNKLDSFAPSGRVCRKSMHIWGPIAPHVPSSCLEQNSGRHGSPWPRDMSLGAASGTEGLSARARFPDSFRQEGLERVFVRSFTRPTCSGPHGHGRSA